MHMNTSRTCAGVIVLDNIMYVIGGTDRTGQALKCCEKYDPKTDTWTAIASK